MANELRMATQSRPAGALILVGRWLLLTPEAAVITSLLCFYLAAGQPPLIALLIALVVVGFTVRIAALHLAREAVEGGRYGQADALAQVALALYPWSADAQALRGVVAMVTGATDSAEAALRQAITLVPGHPAFHAALSGALLDQGRPVEAATAAREALALDQRYAPAYLYLADARGASGAPATEIEDLLREGIAVARHPAETAALQCALVGRLFAEQRMAEAMLLLNSTEVIMPRCSNVRRAELRYKLGELLAAYGQVERASACFQDVKALDPQGRYAAAAWRSAQL